MHTDIRELCYLKTTALSLAHTTMANYSPFPSFEYESDKTNVAIRWEKWVKRLENLFVPWTLRTGQDSENSYFTTPATKYMKSMRQRRFLLRNTYDDTKTVLDKYFRPKKNTQMEIYTFRSCKQKEGQTLDEYVTELRSLSKTCEFTSTDMKSLHKLYSTAPPTDYAVELFGNRIRLSHKSLTSGAHLRWLTHRPLLWSARPSIQ